MKITPYLFFILMLISCNMNDKHTFDKSQFQELYQHEGSANYDVETIYQKDYEVFGLSLYIVDSVVTSYGRTNPLNKKDVDSKRYKISPMGAIMAEGPTDAAPEADGSMFGFDFYSNWLIEGDTTKHKFIDPFSGKRIEDIYEFEAQEKDVEKWMEKFTELYSEADYVYRDMSFFYFKVEDLWYFMDDTLDETSDDLREMYPPKEPKKPKLIDLPDLAPKNFHNPKNRFDTDLIKMIGYESTFFEKEDQGLGSYSFSAGWWYLEIYMPLGDTIRIKRYSNYEDPELQLYEVPSAYGGREDVLFIIQKPEELFPEQVGGMYVIRPRDTEQPDRRYSSISFGDTEKGQPHILRSEETEAYKEWKNKKM